MIVDLICQQFRDVSREEFLATLRHDINNPVHVALGYMEMLGDRLRSEGSPELLGLAGSVTESLKAVATELQCALSDSLEKPGFSMY